MDSVFSILIDVVLDGSDGSYSSDGGDDGSEGSDGGGGGDSTSGSTNQADTDVTTNLVEAYLGCYDDQPRVWHPNQNLRTPFDDDNSPAK